MGGDERLRLFVALPLPEEAVERLVAWQREALADAPAARLVAPRNLHVTLVFLGSRPAADVGPIVQAMRDCAAESGRLVLSASRYRETRSVGMLALADEGRRAGRLAGCLSDRLERLGVYKPERREWLAHVTVLRFRERPRLAPGPPDLGRVSPSEVALYHSVLRPGGAQYEIRESVALGG